ncbi:MAG: DUF2973 domain-containing protein [Cyanobacteria bacterium P01_H01_bin.58]
MLHALYIIAFAVLTVLAVSNLIRNLMLLGADTRRDPRKPFTGSDRSTQANRSTPHPEMLDDAGRVVDEPLLVMKSISLEDAREQLDALYDGPADASEDRSDEDT